MENFLILWHSVDWVPYCIVFIASFFLAKSSWMFWREEDFKTNLKWVMLEIMVPRETTRGPKAMEQFFTNIFNLRNSPVGPKETYVDGEITRWFSFEIVGHGGVTHLYARLPRTFRHPFESSLYAQYPDVEIIEVERDYIHDSPATYQELVKMKYELYGLEEAQKYDPAYPFTTYVDFETKIGDEKGRVLDSMGGILEIIGRLKPDETIWLQFLAQPDTKGHWVHNADKIIDKMKSATQGGKEGEHGGESVGVRLSFRTQAEERDLKRVEEKKGKAIFETTVRMIYFAPKSIFNHDLANRGVHGTIAQFRNNKQSVQKIDKVRSKVEWEAFPWIFPKRRLFWKRVKNLEEYRRRFIPEEGFVGKLANSKLLRLCFFHKPMILSSEELATFFHIPTNIVVTQVSMERIESKRLSPPSNLPN